MVPERSSSTSSSRPLHNFDLQGLRWGSQRFLRCMNVDRANGIPNAPPLIGKRKERDSPENFDSRRSDSRRTRISPENGGGIAAVREKLMFDLQAETDKIKVAMFKDGQRLEEPVAAAAPENPPSFPPPRPVVVEQDSRSPWNLRTRRAACKAPTVPNGGGVTSPVKLTKPNSYVSPTRRSSPANGNEKKERPRFSVPLSRREIEEDFFAITGRKPPRRPQKRQKHVQRNLDTLFPGLWLTEINADMYKVPDDTQ